MTELEQTTALYPSKEGAKRLQCHKLPKQRLQSGEMCEQFTQAWCMVTFQDQVVSHGQLPTS